MRDLVIPIPDFLEKQIAEIEILINGEKRRYNFRVESFKWTAKEDLIISDERERTKARITRLKEQIESYDNSWDLIQIFNPSENSDYVQVLFRQKTDVN